MNLIYRSAETSSFELFFRQIDSNLLLDVNNAPAACHINDNHPLLSLQKIAPCP